MSFPSSLRLLLSFALCGQPAAAASVVAPARLQLPSSALGTSAAPAGGILLDAGSLRGLPSFDFAAPSAAPWSVPGALPAIGAPSLSVPGAPADAPGAPFAAPEGSLAAPAGKTPAPASDAASAVSSDLSGALRRGDSAAVETLGRHFDGLDAAKPAARSVAAPDAVDASGAGLSGRAGSSSVLPDTVDFHGLKLPAAQFSEQGPGWMSSKLIAAMNAARETLDLALLEAMHKELVEAVLAAHRRGVRVRIVIDSTHVYPEKPGQRRSAEIQALLDEGVPMRMLRGGDRHGLMHNKFAVMDGRLLWSGSANWSRAADDVHQENATYTVDAHRLAGFRGVWGWMWGLAKPYGEPAGRANGQLPPQDPDRPIRFHGEGLPAYAFAPGGQAEAWLLKAVELSRKSLDIAMFSCTSGKIKEALLAARARGVRIRLVFDKSQFKYLPPMMWFADNGFDVRLGEGFRPDKSAMHHKFVIFDGELVQNGSYNWTDNAKYNNFENIQFFADASMLAEYAGAYERLRARSRPVSQADIDANRAEEARRELEGSEPIGSPGRPGDERTGRDGGGKAGKPGDKTRAEAGPRPAHGAPRVEGVLTAAV